MVAGADYPDWTAPQAHADSIAATGAPPLTLFNGLTNQLVSLAAGGSGSPPQLTITQPAYEILLNAFETGAGAAGPLEVRMQWYENTGLTFIDQQTFWLWPGTASLGHIVAGKGPTRGGLLVVTFVNHSAVMTYDVHTWLYQRSHYYLRDDWRGISMSNSASGLTLPVTDITSDLIGFRNVSVLAAGSDTTILPLYSGLAQVVANTGSNTSDMTITIQDSAGLTAEGSGGAFFLGHSDTTGLFTAQAQLPRYQCSVKLANGNAAAKTCNYWIHAIN